MAPGSPQSLCLPSGHANTGAVFPARGRPSWRLVLREAIFHRQATPTWARYSRLAASLLASPRRRHLGPGRRGAWRRKNKGLRGGAHHVLLAHLPWERAQPTCAGQEPPAPLRPGPPAAPAQPPAPLRSCPPAPRARTAGPPAAGALFAVMLFINLQKRYNEMARLASGRFGQRKGTRSKQLITGGIMIGERTCLTKSLV